MDLLRSNPTELNTTERLLLKTYSHLDGLNRKPDEYDIATSKLLYYPERDFAVKTPISEWYAAHRFPKNINVPSWEGFSDPERLTYFSYVNSHRDSEIHVQALFESIAKSDELGCDFDPTWLSTLATILSAGRFFYHSLQMIAAYCGKIAPTSEILNCFLFQSANEMRRVQHFAYRLALMRKYHRAEIVSSAEIWVQDPAWQPLRKLTEELFTLSDWVECLSAVNIAVKPILDDFFIKRLSEKAKGNRDELFSEILVCLFNDTIWQQNWTESFLSFIAGKDSKNTDTISGYSQKWKTLAGLAVKQLEDNYFQARGPL